MSILPRTLIASCAVALVAVPAALAHSLTKYGPDLTVLGQGVGATSTTSVSLKLTLSPSYPTAKPGVVVTMTKCNGGKLKLLSRSSLGAGQSLAAGNGKIVWHVSSVPGRPAKPKLSLSVAAPQGPKTLCVSTSMYDNYTRKTIRLATVVPL